MKITVLKGGVAIHGHGEIRDDMAFQGVVGWLPGVDVNGFDQDTTQGLTIALNELNVLFYAFESTGDDAPGWEFFVTEASSEELAQTLALMTSPLPVGATITTEDGYKFSVMSDKTICDNEDPESRDQSYKNLSSLDVDFIYRFQKSNP